ncbi:glycerol kinase GlpK [candidate division KSB1 bacterium]|nr:glycerol kinase GlpK [candidate division KSB1 bacterium]
MLILAIDQGTTGTTTLLINHEGEIVARSYREFPQIYPKPGWVEHNPTEIWQTVLLTVRDVCKQTDEAIAAVGITNQRETTVVWDRETGEPVHNAIVWQCRRTADKCNALREHAPEIHAKTGLPLDAYFSATKIRWILDNIEFRDPAELCFGTIDSWIIWKLTSGKVHATDYTNASRTLLFDITKKQWDPEFCSLFDVPSVMLPPVKPSASRFGFVTGIPQLQGVPIAGVAGDQQAALFGQACFKRGQVKNTYGTGCFTVMNTGDTPIFSSNGLITTIAVNGDGQPCYALEGSIFIAGAAIQWLRDEMKFIENAAESEAIAKSINSTDGVYLVPAFVGLGAPHWDMDARGAIVGLTRGSNRKHIIRAALESIAYQTNDVVKLMESDSGIPIDRVAVDGGASANNFLMQFQADILIKMVERAEIIESTALGAAFLAGLNVGFWESSEKLAAIRRIDKRFFHTMNPARRKALIDGWDKALRQTMVH